MPLIAPDHLPPPYVYHRNRGLMITIRSDPASLAGITPSPLEVNSAGVVKIFAATMVLTQPIAVTYGEMALMIPVNAPTLPEPAIPQPGGGNALFCPLMFVDGDSYLISAGRERQGTRVFAAQTRFARDVSGPLTPPPQDRAKPFSVAVLNHKIIPAVESDRRLIDQITNVPYRIDLNGVEAGLRDGFEVRFGDGRSERLEELIPVKEVIEISAWEWNAELPDGIVVHDFLSGAEKPNEGLAFVK